MFTIRKWLHYYIYLHTGIQFTEFFLSLFFVVNFIINSPIFCHFNSFSLSLSLLRVCIQLTFPNKFACVMVMCLLFFPIQWYSNMSLVTQIEWEKNVAFLYARMFIYLFFQVVVFWVWLYRMQSQSILLSLFAQQHHFPYMKNIANKISMRRGIFFSIYFIINSAPENANCDCLVLLIALQTDSNSRWMDWLDACKNLHCHNLSFDFMRWFCFNCNFLCVFNERINLEAHLWILLFFLFVCQIVI